MAPFSWGPDDSLVTPLPYSALLGRGFRHASTPSASRVPIPRLRSFKPSRRWSQTWRCAFTNLQYVTQAISALTLESIGEAPDVFAFEDYCKAPTDRFRVHLHALLNGAEYSSGELIPFPIRCGEKSRTLAICRPSDLLVYRIALSRIACDLDRNLHDAVCAQRLSKPGPAWKFRTKKASWTQFTARSLSALAVGRPEMLQVDIEDYYPSVAPHVVSAALKAWGARERDSLHVIALLQGWAAQFGLRGLPIGPTGSALIATSLLATLDEVCERHGLEFTRFMDDMRIFGSSLDSTGVQEALAAAANLLGLRLHPRKTTIVEYAEAKHRVTNRTITSLGSALHRGDVDGLERFSLEYLSRSPGDIELPEFRWILGQATRQHLFSVCELLANTEDLMLIDPKSVGQLFVNTECAVRYGDRLFCALAAGISSPDLELQLLRSVTGIPKGANETSLLLEIATDPERLPPVRAWATKALGLDAGQRRIEELVEDEAQPFFVRRAAVGSLRGLAKCRGLLKHVGHRNPDLAPTCDWATAA